jgi:hypothetical protein
MTGILWASIAPIVLSGMLLVQQATLPARPATAPAVDDIIFKGFPFNRNITRDELEKVLGRPTAVSDKQANNRRLSSLRFSGLVVELSGEPISARGTIAGIELSDNRWHFPAKLRIGSTHAEMINLLGKPDIDNPSESIYGCYECVWDDKIHFIFDAGRIKSMKWDFYLD